MLLFDEIDALRGPSLMTVLRQLRAGFPKRPTEYPASVILCGLRDVRDYKAASGGDPERLGTSSPFNVELKSLRVGDFTVDEVRELYAQHTADTGQAFTEEALLRAIEVTAGQPWLVNALASEIVEEMAVPPEQPIPRAHVEEAKERLILARATHLDSLVAKLNEPRVRQVLEPILAGTMDGATDRRDIMITTSRRVLLWSGLAALALAACSSEGATGPSGETSTSMTGGTSTGGGMGGAGGAGGQGGAMEVKEVEVFGCDGVVIEPRITASNADYLYHPSEVTLSVGEVLQFETLFGEINMESGTPPDGDGKFYTPKGYTKCLRFNVAGTYPFFCDYMPDSPMTGTVFVK